MKKRKINSTTHQEKTQVLQRQIIAYLERNTKKPLNYKQIASGLNLLKANERERVIRALQKLTSDKKLYEISPGKYLLNIPSKYYKGIIDFTQQGTAYVIVNDLHRDVFIEKNLVGKALQDDEVKIQIISEKPNKIKGKVVEVLQRNKDEYVGRFELGKNGNFGFVIVDKNQLHLDIFIPKSKFNNAQNGEKVICKLKDFPDDADSPFGEIIKVLGNSGEHEVEIHSILAEYGLPTSFPDEVEREAQHIDTKIHNEEIARRLDMRSITTFTIDPKDAKDFDDALSIQKLKNGNWEIGVHIADVTHYVKEDTLLDNEAYKRATSVYLVDRVVPMLPEILSNNVCSLRPNEEKYTFSAVFELDDNAEIVRQWFGKTVIYSDRRFTYEEAQEIIEGKNGDFEDEILVLNELSKKLRSKRLQNGAIAFDKLEVKFQLDENANPIGVYYKESKDSNHLIEEFMLLANKKVSEFVSLDKKGKPSEKTFIYRIHDDPDPTKLLALKNFVKPLGYHLTINNTQEISTSLNQMLKDVKGKGEENMIESLAMRAMSKAIYSTENIGHYGLAFEYYSHFTSPIRRYPDMIAHRLLQHYLEGKPSPKTDEVEEECKHCSKRERLATDAERDSIKYMQVKFMEKLVGETFDGVVSGVTEFGIYVEAQNSKAEGLIRLRNIVGDSYIFDEKTYSIIGQVTGKQYQLGDKVNIKLLRADLEKKQLDFEIVDEAIVNK